MVARSERRLHPRTHLRIHNIDIIVFIIMNSLVMVISIMIIISVINRVMIKDTVIIAGVFFEILLVRRLG